MTSTRDLPLYPSEAQIARAVLGDRAKEWKTMAIILEREGLPRVNVLTGGRYWPAVVKFFQAYENLETAPEVMRHGRVLIRDFAPDGVNNAKVPRGRRR